ncbi:MAG: RsmB/NOP family class I SAM-dependent RNA methyltransferase [Gammaproteobacteria bacterium]|nr:RsmB/NOP family class I SAM-dependent RNA methyltransferase [Gammaproteobacteria bacterium]
MALPADFLARLALIIPENKFTECVATFAHDSDVVFWINNLLAEPDKVLQELQADEFFCKPIDLFPNAYVLPAQEKQRLVASRLYESGEIYIQNLASMLPVKILDLQPGENILDLTAAPGSKTIQMAAQMQNQGRIVAVEKVKKRFFHLLANLKSHGVTNVKTMLADGTLIWRKFTGQFDKILLDAPCSSEARFKVSNPKTYQFWSLKKITEMQRKQKQLLFSAISCLKPGGTLVYSTCSFAPEENELVIDRVLKKFGDRLSVIDLPDMISGQQSGLTAWKKKKLNPDLKKTIRVLPNKQMHGFYICKLKLNS